MKDPIVEEVRAVRARIAEECGYDLSRIVEHAARAAGALPGFHYMTPEEFEARRAGAVRVPSPATPPPGRP